MPRRRRRPDRGRALLLAAALLLVAGGTFWLAGPRGTQDRPQDAARPATADVLAPPVRLATLDGSVFNLEEQRGEVVVLFFTFVG